MAPLTSTFRSHLNSALFVDKNEYFNTPQRLTGASDLYDIIVFSYKI